MKQIPFLKFKEREETKGILLYYIKADMPLEDYAKIMMRKGWFSIGYNFVLHPDGRMEEGIPATQCCDPSLKGWDDHMLVLVMGQCDGKLNVLQVEALANLSKEYDLTVIREG